MAEGPPHKVGTGVGVGVSVAVGVNVWVGVTVTVEVAVVVGVVVGVATVLNAVPQLETRSRTKKQQNRENIILGGRLERWLICFMNGFCRSKNLNCIIYTTESSKNLFPLKRYNFPCEITPS